MTPRRPRAERLRVRWLGRLGYREAWDLQRAIHDARASGAIADDHVLLLEHPPTYTIGRNGGDDHLKLPLDRVEEMGAEVLHVDRGGDITYHGPGQLVGYPIVAVPRLERGFDVVGHVRRLERALIDALADLGVEAWAEPGYTGVWTARGKVAAIGVRVSEGAAMHGFALNVAPDLTWFSHIVPCGIADRPVTSVAELVGGDIRMEDAVRAVIPHLGGLSEGEPEVQLGAFVRGAGRPYDVDEMVARGVFSPHRDGTPVTIRGVLEGEPPRPPWLRVRATSGSAGYRGTAEIIDGFGLTTVCEEAGCPNIYECWQSGTATLMLLGDRCTRACAFCDVTTGRPGPVDGTEPRRAAEAVAAMGLRHAVLTSVNRDDLPDGGAGIFAATIRAIRDRVPGCTVEVLIPDFKGDLDALETVMQAKPEVLNHNTETVLRLQRDIRTAANYGRSLALLARARRIDPGCTVKSGLIVGMGETEAEVMGALADLRAVGVDIVTIGQYLRPTPRHRRVHRYVTPEEFARYAAEGKRLGIAHVEAGPLVRSSYHARDSLAAAT